MKPDELEMKEKVETYLDNIEIPAELEERVRKSIEIGTKKERVITMRTWMRRAATSAAVVAIGFVGSANLSPAFAKAMSDVPVLGGIVKVVSFRQFDFNEENYQANIEVPVIEGMSNKTLEQSLNQKYLEENKKLYNQFEAEVAEMKQFEEGGHLGVDSGYDIKTNNEQILSIGRYVVNTVASSSTTVVYDTIDKKNEVLITLPSLFKNDSYIKAISENIKAQMRERMANDDSLVYWIENEDETVEGFQSISDQTQFYITDQGKLVISFDKYEVAPGYMGVQEFEIPTEVLQGTLVSNEYIK